MKTGSLPFLACPACVICLICLVTAGAGARSAGEIVFASHPIDPAAPADLTELFQAGDPIYAMAYLGKDLPGLANKKTAKQVGAEVFLYELKPPLYDYQQPSEEQLQTGTLTVSGPALRNDYLMVDIVPEPEGMTAYGADLSYRKFGDVFDGPVGFAEKLGGLEAGDHTIVVKLTCNYAVVAEGRFTLTGDDFSAYETAAANINAAAQGLKTRDTTMPGAVRSDPALEAEMVAAFEASQTFRDRIKGEVQRIVIIDPDWIIRRNELTGVVLHRYIRAAIAVKNADGTCTLWNLVTFQQDYVGDAFQMTRFDGVGDPAPIPCEAVIR